MANMDPAAGHVPAHHAALLLQPLCFRFSTHHLPPFIVQRFSPPQVNHSHRRYNLFPKYQGRGKPKYKRGDSSKHKQNNCKRRRHDGKGGLCNKGCDPHLIF
ncbi:hypothetical protein L1049_003220 [Liquidambar formosana]|uniref:Uncharacterized protein n=1 Tax=Liquidambar formosana TaxID=63359 RepID=A0AAP0NJA7_LIQFO